MSQGSAGGDVERVLAVPRQALLEANLLGLGFRRHGFDRALRLVEAAGEFLSRPRAEEDPGWKQVIPYALVTSRGKILLLRRSSRGAEPRLHDRFSIGVGGHINPGPAPPERRVEEGLHRELEEELVWGGRCRPRPLGLLNDDSDAVGRVHFGLVYRVSVPSPRVEVRETELLEGSFATLDELRQVFEGLESWSRWVARELFESPDLLAEPEPASHER